ncbi:protein KBP homolog [Camponotus floridanus]|uniref:protein KBP homolog n=1 Tax=Camponotus floridanus TaxID=104421 RepID=UPI000DC69FF1|nr:protein KBP homolog [Camponotus floridanus]
MFAIVEHIIKYRTYEFLQSEDANSVESHEDINVDSKFLQVLKLSFEIKNSQMKQIPFKTKKKIKTLEAKMEDLFRSTTMTTNVTLDNIIVLAIAYLNMGLIYVDSKEENELCAGKNYFMRCIELLKGKELDRKAILTSIEVYTKLQCILNKLQKPKTSELLYEAMELYLKYTEEENKYPNPINIPSILGIEKEKSNSRLLLADVYLTTVDYLVKRYKDSPKNDDKLVIYIHNLLNKEIPETMKFQNVGCYYWALASIDLTQYFLCNHRFTEARHHLAAADYIMEEFHKFINETISSEYYTLMLDKYQNAHANIARYWATYGNKLLCSSKEKLFQRNEESCKTDNSKSESLMSSEKNITDFLLFTDFKKDLRNITSTITDTYVSNINDAKTVFVNILKWLNTAKLYFTIENNFVIYGQTLLEISKAYKYLAYFEHSKDNLIKLYKRQIDHLEDAIKELHPKAKKKEELYICKIIHFELGIAYSTFANSETCQSMKNATKHFTSYLNMS